jgi:integral membrane sensor domain MASE1
VLVSAFLVNQTTAGNMVTSAAIAVGNTIEALLGAYLANRFAGGRKAFWHAEGVLRFAAVVAFLSTTVSATTGVTSLSVAGYADWADFGAMWLTWWLGDAAGALIVAPMLVLRGRPIDPSWRHRRVLSK